MSVSYKFKAELSKKIKEGERKIKFWTMEIIHGTIKYKRCIYNIDSNMFYSKFINDPYKHSGGTISDVCLDTIDRKLIDFSFISYEDLLEGLQNIIPLDEYKLERIREVIEEIYSLNDEIADKQYRRDKLLSALQIRGYASE